MSKLALNQNVKLWLKALRSNKFKQANGVLREPIEVWNQQKQDLDIKGQQYCALGVAMAVAEQHGVTIKERDWHTGFLPRSVRDWLGVKSNNRHVKLNGEVVSELNDDGMGFKEIAKEIENHPQAFGKPRVKSTKIGAKTTKKSKKAGV